MFFSVDLHNDHPTVTIGVSFHALVLDSEGNVYLTDHDYFDLGWGGAQNKCQTPTNDVNNAVLLKAQPVGEDESVPDNVQGVFTAIFAINDVYDYDDFQEKGMAAAGMTTTK